MDGIEPQPAGEIIIIGLGGGGIYEGVMLAVFQRSKGCWQAQRHRLFR